MAKFPETSSKIGPPSNDTVPNPQKPQGQPKGVKGIESTYNR